MSGPRLRDRLVELLAEDPGDPQALLRRLDTLADETDPDPAGALLEILTQLPFDAKESAQHWEMILDVHARMSAALGRPVGVRVAVLDYFLNVEHRLALPALIELDALAELQRDPVDPLTGLWGAAAFRSAVEAELRRVRRSGRPAAVVLMDLDDFAIVNDEFGPHIADRVLKDAARLLTNLCRDVDFAARPGEDELALLLPETDGREALRIAERFRAETDVLFAGRSSGGRALHVTVSAGVAAGPVDATTSDALLGRAAQALYEAKARGKNRVRAFHPERRRHPRVELAPDTVEVRAAGGAPETVLSRNLSRSGVLLTSPYPIPVGQPLEVRIGEFAGTCRGEVVRLTERRGPGTDRYEVGVAFAAGDEGPDPLEILRRSRRPVTGRRP